MQKGAQGIILGCTEIGLLIKQENVSVPIFDTTHIHAIEAVKVALESIIILCKLYSYIWKTFRKYFIM